MINDPDNQKAVKEATVKGVKNRLANK